MIETNHSDTYHLVISTEVEKSLPNGQRQGSAVKERKKLSDVTSQDSSKERNDKEETSDCPLAFPHNKGGRCQQS
jgi:hypothetical protein